MRPRKPEAAKLEQDYLARVGTALAGREPSEIDEVIESLRAHIEDDLSQDSALGDVGLVRMANILEQLGPPESYILQEDAAVPVMDVAPTRMSVKAILAALTFPAALVVTGLMMAVEEATGTSVRNWEAITKMMNMAVLLTGMVLCFWALSDIKRSGGRLRGKRVALLGLLPPMIAAVAFLLYRIAVFDAAAEGAIIDHRDSAVEEGEE